VGILVVVVWSIIKESPRSSTSFSLIIGSVKIEPDGLTLVTSDGGSTDDERTVAVADGAFSVEVTIVSAGAAV